MTVKDLIERLQRLDGDRIVVLAKDAEGNNYDTLYSIDSNCSYKDGEIGLEKLTPSLKERGYSKEDVKEGQRAVVFYP